MIAIHEALGIPDYGLVDDIWNVWTDISISAQQVQDYSASMAPEDVENCRRVFGSQVPRYELYVRGHHPNDVDFIMANSNQSVVQSFDNIVEEYNLERFSIAERLDARRALEYVGRAMRLKVVPEPVKQVA